MKDEIKEILDNFKIYEDRYKKCNETQFIIFYRDIHLLLDYITNLQEENERLNKIIDVERESYDVQETIIDMQKMELLELEDYKSRNEKAIKLLKEAGCYDEETKTFCDDVWEELPKLLNILNGDDE